MMTQKKEIKTKKICRFTQAKIKYIDYKNVKLLQKFVSEQGRIIPKRLIQEQAQNINDSLRLPLKEHVIWRFCHTFLKVFDRLRS